MESKQGKYVENESNPWMNEAPRWPENTQCPHMVTKQPTSQTHDCLLEE